ncbi:SLAM family member 9-like [Sebastes umbrosus]|uniref:SLAM family member 9-like n=1 Tax=Sebastes umbrosus TaxID=72105 RepID=UPI00189E4C61|nr:SLAM family member 9-like [Sebastes umbrosus]
MMGKQTGLCVLLLVLNVAVTEDTVTTVYFTDGGDLTLKVRPPLPDHINYIMWIFNDNLLAEWVEDKSYYLRLKGRANLTTETGQLIINKMSKKDEGVYSVEINGRVQSERYQAKLIKKVQKPKVVERTLSCGALSDSCKFSCDSNTTEAEPVSYSWKKGDGEWEVSGKDITITREEFTVWSTFTCRIENPVSQEESDPKPNPVYISSIIRSIVIDVLLVFLLFWCLFEAFKMMKGYLKNRGSNITDPAHVNGDVQPTAHPSDSATNPAENIPLQDNPEDLKSDAKETA